MRPFLPCLLAALVLAGCEGMPQRAPAESEATAAQGYGRAFGRARHFVDGRELVPKASSGERLVLFVRAVPGESMQYMDIGPGGDFAWPLRPGDYDIVAYQSMRNMGGMTGLATLSGRVMARFTVPRAGSAVYVGELRIERRGGAERIAVNDDYDAAAASQGRLVAGGFQPAKGLMRLAQPPGNVRRMAPICAAMWGLSCDRTFQGVVPVSPKGVGEDFPTVADLRPVLEWQPSRRADVTYDVAIYESLNFMYGATGRASRLRGSLVAYAEGLSAPRFQPAQNLPAGKKFEWTVRVRDGDTVSTWSSTSYAAFLLFAAVRGSGQNFGFRTPER